MSLLDLWDDSQEFLGLLHGLKTGDKTRAVVGLQGTQRSFMVAALWHKLARTGLFVLPGEKAALQAKDDLETFLGPGFVHYFPTRSSLPYEVIAQSHEGMGERLSVLRALSGGERCLVVTTIEAAVGRLMPPAVFTRLPMNVAPGSTLPLSHVAERLAALGYVREKRVEAPGQVAVRGGIVDVWDPTADFPLRLEMVGDEVESIRVFESASQRSRQGALDRVTIGAAREVVLTPDAAAVGLQGIRRELAATCARLRRGRDGAERVRALEAHVQAHMDAWGTHPTGEAVTRFLPFFYPAMMTLLDYLPQGALVFAGEPERLRETAGVVHREASERATTLLGEGALLPSQADVVASWHHVQGALDRHQTIEVSVFYRKGATLGHTTTISCKGVENFHGSWGLFSDALERERKSRRRVLICAATEERYGALMEALKAENILPAAISAEGSLAAGEVGLVRGTLENGFLLPDLNLWVATDFEIYGRPKKRRHRSEERTGERLKSYLDLSPGDFVVHVHHGIGRYLGLHSMDIDGIRKDYLHLQYAGADKLYVPTDQIHLVSKYIGQEGHAPKLSRLGGGDWAKVKAKVKASVREMAEELLKLYAKREATPGVAFAKDGPWMRELEASFSWEETEDQKKAMEEIRRDLERARPMDRLLCGDVGYGKTELAIRAALKVAMSGKQVAVLVPTTILAQQHFDTFSRRLEGFPVEVALLSRFRSTTEQRQTLERARKGLVDVVIGTHRLLGKDVQFKDLGLLVVDEEQRFGVAHKERLKQLKERVDVLTLTATPIPRTLHMSLVGLRDMSLIETPPEDRFPVQTFVVEENAEMIEEAVRREMDRGGQVFYVYNRVETIDEALLKLKRLVPEARIALAHGQMPEGRLERTMVDFLAGDYDVLLATTIIESGLDIPNVNTLIVEQADTLGLAQMYQLRGRIGRSNRQGYAYFTYRKNKALTEVAQKRLEAIREFTEFGSGFKIAMRDLEIRGTGNILGPQQHGFIVAVGFDLYVDLLHQAVAELRGEKTEEPVLPSFDLPVHAFIPETYIPEESQRIEVYKRFAAVNTVGEADDLLSELEDRFGPAPDPVRNLAVISRLRVQAGAVGISSIKKERNRVILSIGELGRLPAEQIEELGKQFKGKISFQAGQAPHFAFRTVGQEPSEVLPFLESVFGFLHQEAVHA